MSPYCEFEWDEQERRFIPLRPGSIERELGGLSGASLPLRVWMRTFTKETLLKWKCEHEGWVFSRLQQIVPTIGFAELEVVCQGIVGGQHPPSEPSMPTPPAEKMRKNGLTEKLRLRLKLGLSVFSEVEHFVQSVARLNPHFPEQLKAGFVLRYNEFLQRSIQGDALPVYLHGEHGRYP